MTRDPRNGTLETVDGRPALRFERRLAAPVARVWRAVSEPAELGRWFVGTVGWTPAAGETFDVGGMTVAVREVVPERALEWTAGADRFRFDLAPDGDGCVLVFTHVFGDRDLAAQTAAGWETYLERLDAHLAGGFLDEEEAHDDIGARHERAARELGIDPARGRRTIAGMGFRGLRVDGGAVRLERRYPHPAARLWRALTDADEARGWLPDAIAVDEAVPERRVAGTCAGARIRVELAAEGGACTLAFSQVLDHGADAADAAADWDRRFARLDAHLAGASVDAAQERELWAQVRARYAGSTTG